jgi:hypothetical protein
MWLDAEGAAADRLGCGLLIRPFSTSPAEGRLIQTALTSFPGRA